jgi:hypothetical protein
VDDADGISFSIHPTTRLGHIRMDGRQAMNQKFMKHDNDRRRFRHASTEFNGIVVFMTWIVLARSD